MYDTWTCEFRLIASLRPVLTLRVRLQNLVSFYDFFFFYLIAYNFQPQTSADTSRQAAKYGLILILSIFILLNSISCVFQPQTSADNSRQAATYGLILCVYLILLFFIYSHILFRLRWRA